MSGTQRSHTTGSATGSSFFGLEPPGHLHFRRRDGGATGGTTGPGDTSADGSAAGPGPGSAGLMFYAGGGSGSEVPSSMFFHFPVCRGSAPPARWAHSAVVVAGGGGHGTDELFVFGGVGHSMMDDLCALDVHTLTWRNVTQQAQRSKDRPEKMLGHAAAAVGPRIWVFGGQSGRKFLRTLYCFCTETCMWSRFAPDSLPAARAGHAMVTVHGSTVYM